MTDILDIPLQVISSKIKSILFDIKFRCSKLSKIILKIEFW